MPRNKKSFERLLDDGKTAYIRVGRNPVEDVYTRDDAPFEMDRATWLRKGTDAAIIACGEMVGPAYNAAKRLAEKGISCSVLDMYCIKPLDREAIINAAQNAKLVVTVEEHSPYGGLGSMVCQTVCANSPKKVINLALPDAPVVAGNSREIFAWYHLDEDGIMNTVMENIDK